MQAKDKLLSNIGWVLPDGDGTNIRFKNYDNAPSGYFPNWYATLLIYGGFRSLFGCIETCKPF